MRSARIIVGLLVAAIRAAFLSAALYLAAAVIPLVGAISSLFAPAPVLLFSVGVARARLRAAVDNPRAARGLGIDVNRVFTLAFALGSALAGLGGALGIEILGLDPGFPVKYIVYFLIVVAVGGSGSINGSLLAALILGIADVAGKYYLPEFGAFVIYAVMVSMLIFRPQGLLGRTAAH